MHLRLCLLIFRLLLRLHLFVQNDFAYLHSYLYNEVRNILCVNLISTIQLKSFIAAFWEQMCMLGYLDGPYGPIRPIGWHLGLGL
jgi:hypothetical protein